MNSIQTICVCGAGTMGSGIALTAAQHGFYTLLYDINPAMLEKAEQQIRATLDKLVAKQKISAGQQQQVLSRLRYTSDLQVCLADVIIEAVVEKIAVKTALFNQLAELNHREVIFATNTSSLPVTAIAEKTVHPERVIGMHFFNPATIMKLVEVVNTHYTNPATTASILELAKAMGKTPVQCKDAPGFIVNHVARPYYLESLKIAENGWADFETIDTLLEASGFKMGPFRLMDLIGNDINYAVSVEVHQALDKPIRLEPSPLQKEKVDQGALGRKSGRGYYHYDQ